MADNPTNPGTPLTKETLLQDSTEIEIFGNASNRTVDEAFSGLMNRIDLIMQNVASMALTITDTAGNPIPGVYVNGVFDDDGNALKTNASGQINGYVAEGDSTLSITSYADITPYSEVFTAVKGQSYTKTIQVTTRNFLRLLSSGQYRFSENVSQVDVSVGGAGGGGEQGWYSLVEDDAAWGGGPGGGGGYAATQTNVDFAPNTLYQAVVGASGKGGYPATAGGTSSFLGVSAQGGQPGEANGLSTGIGGAGNGNGANSPYLTGDRNTRGQGRAGTNGNPGTGTVFSSFTETVPYGGGGASGGANSPRANYGGGTGGTPNGGDGGPATSSSNGDGESPAAGTGGGGGGGTCISAIRGAGGDGGSGVVAIRMHLTTTA